MKHLKEDLRRVEYNLSGQVAKQNPDERAIKEFYAKAKKKKLSLEAVFRVCDRDNKGMVSVGAFKETLEQLDIALTRGQISRLCIMFDEDNEGSITAEEWRSTLEAY